MKERSKGTHVTVASLAFFRLPLPPRLLRTLIRNKAFIVIRDNKSNFGRGSPESRLSRSLSLSRPSRGFYRVASLFLNHGLCHGRSLGLQTKES